MRTSNMINDLHIEEVRFYNDHRPARMIKGTGQLAIPDGYEGFATSDNGIESDHQLYSIRFHLKSGKVKDMPIDAFDRNGIPNRLSNAITILGVVDNKLKEHGAWINNSFDGGDPNLNFRIFDHAIEFIEVIER